MSTSWIFKTYTYFVINVDVGFSNYIQNHDNLNNLSKNEFILQKI